MKGVKWIYASLGVTLGLYLLAKLRYPADDWTQMMSQLLGLVGIMLLSFSFILSIRHKKLEQIFGGLDHVYKLHHIVGGSALIALLFHPLFSIIGALPHNSLSLYLIPGFSLDYTLGQLSLYLMLFLLILTFYIELPYRYWKWTHEWMGLVIMLGGLHSILVFSDVARVHLLMIWIEGWAILATMAYLYKRFFYYAWAPRGVYRIEAIGSDHDLMAITTRAVERQLEFGPGQYGFFAHNDWPRDEHTFSILGSERGRLIIGVKKVGFFTTKLAKMKAGDTLTIRGPYGTFGEKMVNTKHAVWIAGGIGITPFLSMAKAIKPSQKVDMYFCAKVMPAKVFTEPFVSLVNKNSNFRFLPCETSKEGHLSAKRVLEETGSDTAALYLLCGPKPMMEQLATDLAKLGVARSHIIYEDFAFK